MKLLLTADIHIGRRPGGLPAGIDGRQYSAGALWAAIVDKAIDEKVDAVLLGGDVVDRDNRMCEAFGPLERGIRKLGALGIQTVAVSGNHDFDVLPALTRVLPDECFHLVGQKGKWERFTVEKEGKPVLLVDGWSYPAKHVRFNPVPGYDLPAPGDGVPLVGLLHTDVDKADHPYAPVSSDELRAKPPRFWLLGHNHGPDLKEHGVAPILCPGAPQAVTRKDFGAHGVWIGELAGGAGLDVTFHPLARVQYESLDVDLGGAGSTDDVRVKAIEAMREALHAAVEQNQWLEYVLCRMRLTGRCKVLGELDSTARQLKEDLQLSEGDLTGSIEKITVSATPDYDLAELARETEVSAVGTLAGLLISLENGTLSTEYPDLVRAAGSRIEAVGKSGTYSSARLPEEAPDVEGHIREQGMRLLDALIAQRAGRSP